MGKGGFVPNYKEWLDGILGRFFEKKKRGNFRIAEKTLVTNGRISSQYYGPDSNWFQTPSPQAGEILQVINIDKAKNNNGQHVVVLDPGTQRQYDVYQAIFDNFIPGNAQIFDYNKVIFFEVPRGEGPYSPGLIDIVAHRAYDLKMDMENNRRESEKFINCRKI